MISSNWSNRTSYRIARISVDNLRSKPAVTGPIGPVTPIFGMYITGYSNHRFQIGCRYGTAVRTAQ